MQKCDLQQHVSIIVENNIVQFNKKRMLDGRTYLNEFTYRAVKLNVF